LQDITSSSYFMCMYMRAHILKYHLINRIT